MNQPNADQAVLIIITLLFDALLLFINLALIAAGIVLAIMYPSWTPLEALR